MAESPPGPVERAVHELIAGLTFAPGDPRHVIGLVALQLAAGFDRQPGSVSLARELRGHLGWLTENAASPPGALDEIRARRAARRVVLLLGDRDAV